MAVGDVMALGNAMAALGRHRSLAIRHRLPCEAQNGEQHERTHDQADPARVDPEAHGQITEYEADHANKKYIQ